jgi:hypothetical protein
LNFLRVVLDDVPAEVATAVWTMRRRRSLKVSRFGNPVVVQSFVFVFTAHSPHHITSSNLPSFLMDYDTNGIGHPAIICGYVLVAADFARLARETPGICERMPPESPGPLCSISLGDYDFWRRSMPRDVQMQIPKVRGTYVLF